MCIRDRECLAIIEGILEEPELNKVYKGTVVKIVEFGAFVNIYRAKMGYCIFQKYPMKELKM